MDLASVVAALASVGVRVSGSTPNNNIQGDSSRACPTGLAGPEPSGTHNDPGQHFQSCSCSTCCFGLGVQLQNLQDFIKIYRALIKDILPVAEASLEYLSNRL